VLKVTWFLRGILAALLFVGLVDQYTAISRLQFLSWVHAVLLGWDRITASIGALIGELPYLPRLLSFEVDAITVVTTMFVPAWAAAHLNNHAEEPVGRTQEIIDKVAGTAALIFGSYVTFGFYCAAVGGDQSRVSDSFFPYVLSKAWGPFAAAASLVIGFCLACLRLPGYFRGLVYLSSFIGTMTLLYYLETPAIAHAMDEFTQAVLGPRL
jgi:hypothetical protein